MSGKTGGVMGPSLWVCLVIFSFVTACGESRTGTSNAGGTDAAAGDAPGPATAGSDSGSSNAGGNGVGGGNAGAATIETYPTQYAEAACALLERCWPSFTLELTESCESYFERTIREGGFANIAAAVGDGRVTYDAPRAQSCLEAFAAQGCEENLNEEALEGCDQILVGSLEAGDECSLDAECSNVGQCLVDVACPGRCGPRAQEGEACSTHNRCDPDLTCLIGASGEGTCVAQAAAGATCSATRPCTSFHLCAGLVRSDPSSTGICEPREALYSGSLGEACGLGTDGRLCQKGLVCAPGDDGSGADGTCQPEVASGAPCPLALPDACPKDEYCRIADLEVMPRAGTCTPRPKLGQQCSYAPPLFAPCAAEQYCSTITGNCELSRHLGESCTADEQCFSQTCVGEKCVALLECEQASL